MKQVFQPEWRTHNRTKRRFYAKYMTWLERIGYLVVLGVVLSFVYAFNYPVDDLVSADNVKLTPASVPVKATQPTWIVKAMKADFDDVHAGDQLVEVVEGEAAIQAYTRWQKVSDLAADAGPSPELATLAKKYAKPPTRIIAASKDGTFRIDPKQTMIDADAEICRVVDYDDIRLSASLAGDTIARATAGQWARITNLDLGSKSGTILRAASPEGTLLSTRLLGEPVKKMLSDRLHGMAVRFRDDVPLSISDITEVQVDASVNPDKASDARDPSQLAPPPTYTLRAQVLDGVPTASAQVADLPKDLEDQVTSIVKSSVGGHAVRDVNGANLQIKNADNIRLLVKMKAQNLAPANTPTLKGTSLKRTFDANLKLESPPLFLTQALKEADRNGKDITARVELRTGSRPIALILVKKS